MHEELPLQQSQLLRVHHVTSELASELSGDLIWHLRLSLAARLPHACKCDRRKLQLATQDSLVLLIGYLIVRQRISESLFDCILVLLLRQELLLCACSTESHLLDLARVMGLGVLFLLDWFLFIVFDHCSDLINL